MKNKGFTLVELLAVIIIIGLLTALALPSALKMGSQVKNRAYSSKIEILEKNAISYGESNIALVRKGTDPLNLNNHYTCKMEYDKDEITKINYNKKTSGYSDTTVLADNEFWCIRSTLENLVEANALDWDETDVCEGRCSDEEKKDYNNVILNPKDNYIMNKCYVYIYYKYNRVYAKFDSKTCAIQANNPILGQEYARK